jgi:zinc transport system ATP-binding protein
VFGRIRAADRRAVAEAVEAVGLTDLRRVPVSELSGGQQRRTIVARALAGGPDVLVFDEPFAGVDRATQEALTVTFADLVRRGATVIVVLHEIGPLGPLVTRAVTLVSGEVVDDGPPTLQPHGMAAAEDHAETHCDAPEPVPGLGLLAR